MARHFRFEINNLNIALIAKGGDIRTLVDPFLADEVGEGGYGEAYRVLPQPGFPAAGIMKVFNHWPLECEPGDTRRYNTGWDLVDREYEMLRQLDGLGGHVPKVFASGYYIEVQNSGKLRVRPAFVMEEIGDPAKPLSNVVSSHMSEKHSGFDASRTATFGLKLLDIIDMLQDSSSHRAVAHADLSPSNVFVRLSEDGQSFEWLYLIDFGQGKYSAQGVTPSNSKEGVRFGQLPYTAPELVPKVFPKEGEPEYLFEHERYYDSERNHAGADVWSLGALMYYVATGDEPRLSVHYKSGGYWRGDEQIEDSQEAYRILLKEKRPGICLPDYMSEEGELKLSKAIRCCTEWNPSKRDRGYIRRLLEQAVQGGRTESQFESMSQVTPVTPPQREEKGKAGTVLAGAYKMYRSDGTPFSENDIDLLLFGDAKDKIDVKEYTYQGIQYDVVHTEKLYDLSKAGWGVTHWACDSPWQTVQIVDFVTKVKPQAMTAWFAGCSQLVDILHIDRLDTSATTDMQFLFHGCSSLEYVDVFGFDTSNVERMNAMFHDCSALEGVNVSSFDTANVVSMAAMFQNCSALSVLDVSRFSTRKVKNFSYMFSGCSRLSRLDVSRFDTSCATNLGFMFNDCSALRRLDVSRFVTGAATYMAAMFQNCRMLDVIDVSHFDTSSAESLAGLFMGCESVRHLDVSRFQTGRAKDMRSMFSRCKLLRSIDTIHFDTSCAVNCNHMFNGCSALEHVDVSRFRTGNAKYLNSMFAGCSSLEAVDVSGFDTLKAVDLSYMFYNCSSLKSIGDGFDPKRTGVNTTGMFDGCDNLPCPENVYAAMYKMYHQDGSPYSDKKMDLLVFGQGEEGCRLARCSYSGETFDLRQIDQTLSMRDTVFHMKDGVCDSPWQDVEAVFFASKVAPESMRDWFAGCERLKYLSHIGNLDASRATDMQFLFYECKSLTSLDLSTFDTSSVRFMNSMFSGCSALRSLDVSGFDTSAASNMGWMFYGCSNLESLDVSGFRTGGVKDLQSMFDGCSSLQSLDVSRFDTSGAKRLNHMFYNCSSLEFIDVSGFETSAAEDLCAMFSGCKSLERLDVSRFDASSASRLCSMFNDCWELRELDLSHFDTSKATSLDCMFADCSKLRKLDVSGFNTSRITDMRHVFLNCSSLTELDVSHFDTRSAEDMTCMFAGCSGLLSLDVSSFDTSSATDMGCMFSGCSGLTQLDISNFNTSKVKNFKCMFYQCSSLKRLNAENLNLLNAADVSWMFADCGALEKLLGYPFAVGKDANTENMYNGCSKLLDKQQIYVMPLNSN